MKLALTIVSWVAIVIGALAILGGIGKLTTDPTTAYYDFTGGGLFALQGVLALVYINTKEK